MASTYSPKLRLELIGAGEQAGLWGTTTNKNIGQLLEQAIAGVTTVELDGVSGNYTLTALDGAPDQSRSAVLKCTYNAVPASGPVNIIIPTQTKLYVVRNECGQSLTVKTASQVGGVQLDNGEATLVFCDGTDAVLGLETAAAGTLGVDGGGTGRSTFTAGFVKSPGGTSALTTAASISLTDDVSGVLPIANGGTGQNGTPSNGQLLIGNGTGFSRNTLTAGSGITISNTSGQITISSSGGAGTVTSVGISGSNISVSGSPITSSGTISISIPQAIGTSDSVRFGSVGVGTSASGTTGEIRATNNITAYYSDDRLKTRLGNIENALDKLCSLTGFFYEANQTAQDLGYDAVREVGVSAQDVQKVLPEVVVPAPIDDKYLTVRYEKLIPLLIEAIKELRAEVADLKEKANGA